MSDLKFFEIDWKPYNDVLFKLNRQAKQNQTSKLYYTGLTEGRHGGEYSFIPTKFMSTLNNILSDKYKPSTDIVEESLYSTKIEGCMTSYERAVEINNGSYVDEYNEDENMIKGYLNCQKLLAGKEKLTEDLLLNLWNIMVENCCHNSDIRGSKYRSGNVQVGKHIAMNFYYVPEAMPNWIEFFNNNELKDNIFIKASLLHAVFEIIHPFCDGNGRLGRLLMQYYLQREDYSIFPSKLIYESLSEYYYMLELAENVYSDCTPFIEYMLRIFVKL